MEHFSLTRANRLWLARLFATVPQVDVSIQAVLEDQMGTVFVDDLDQPRYAMIEMDGFFIYYAGDMSTDEAQAFIAQTPHGRMLMAGSEGWHEVIQSVFDADSCISITRCQYDADKLSRDHIQSLIETNPNTPHIQAIDTDMIADGIPFFEMGAFDSAEDFVQRGIGFCMIADGKNVGVAYSSLVCSDAIEVSIVVDDNHRRKGIATALAGHLLDWCLAHQVRPNWDAANEESCGLAEKLGYHNKRPYTAYFLKPE